MSDYYWQFTHDRLETGASNNYITVNECYTIFREWFHGICNLPIPEKAKFVAKMEAIMSCKVVMINNNERVFIGIRIKGVTIEP